MAFGLPPNDVRPCRSNVHTSAPSFTLPPHTLRRRPRRLRPSAAIVIHNALSTEKLSTSLLAALCITFSPSRLRTRIYNISFASRPLPGSVRAAVRKRSRRCDPVSRVAVRRVGEGEGKGGRPLAQCRAMPLVCRITVRKGGVHKANPAPARAFSPRQLVYGRAPACLRPNHCAQRRKCTRPTPPLPVRSPRGNLSTAAPLPACVPNHCAQRWKCSRPTPPLPVRSPRGNLSTAPPRPLMTKVPSAGWGRVKAKADAPLRSNPHFPRLRPRPRRLNGSHASAGGRENDRMAHRRTTTPTHRTQRGNDTCTIRVPRRKGAQSVVHNLYFSSSRPASFCTTFPQSCTDRPVKCRKEHKSPPEGLIFRVLPPAFPPFLPKAIVQNTPAPPPFFPRKTPRFAPTRNRARTLASAERDNTPRPAHSSRFQRDTNELAAHELPIFAPPKAENGGVCGLKC